MFFKRSTRAIVDRGKTKERTRDHIDFGDIIQPLESSERKEAVEASGEDKTYWEGKLMMVIKNMPQWARWAAGGAMAILMIALIIALVNSMQKPETAVSISVADDQAIIAVHADPALSGQVVPGDVVRLYTAAGQLMPELQYVQVYKSIADSGLLLLVDDGQAAVLVGQENSPKVVLVVHDDMERAVALLDLQARINDPRIYLVLQPEELMAPTETLELSCQVKIEPVEAILPQIEWTSSDPAVATVEGGIVTAHGVGQAVITGVCGNVTASCAVTVEVPLGGIILDKTEAVLAVGETAKLTAEADPADATHFNVIWTVSDPEIATISEDGTITGITPGTTTVTATSGDVTATCAVTVGYHAEVVQLDMSAVTVATGQDYKLASVTYPGTNVIDVGTYETSDPAIATVAEDGTVTGVAPGTATITFRCGNAAATCIVTVTAAPGQRKRLITTHLASHLRL